MNKYHVCLPGKVSHWDKDNKTAQCVNCDKHLPIPARTRHAFRSYDECAHVWAQQNLGYGSCYSMYFEGRSIYSYGSHFEIARFIAPNVLLFTTRDYSNTTSKHKWAVTGAIEHLTVYEVPNFDDHTENAQHFISLIESQVQGIRRGRAALTSRVSNLGETQTKAARFLAAFKKDVDGKVRAKLSALTRKTFFTDAELRAFEAKEKRHEESARRARETKQRNDAIRWRNINRIANVEAAHVEALSHEAEAFWGSEIAELNRVAWLSGDERARIPYDGPVLLRLVNDQDEIETSRGAFVPTTRAIDLFRAIKAGKNINGFEIGHYKVTGIHDRKLVIGCHQIPLPEVMRMAKTLGLVGAA